MSLKTRITKIEKYLPKEDLNHPIIWELGTYGYKPSEADREIAVEKVMELNPNEPFMIIYYIPYGSEHIIKPKGDEKVKWDYKLGLGIYRKTVYKLVEKCEDDELPS